MEQDACSILMAGHWRKPEAISKQEGRGAESDARGEVTAEFHSGKRYSKEIAQQRSWTGWQGADAEIMFEAKFLILRKQHCRTGHSTATLPGKE